jgi:tetratricopeptide (TPR) repeat protein
MLELLGRYDEALQTYNELQEFGRQQADPSIEMAALMAKAPIYSTFTPLHDSKLSEQMLLQALKISQEIGDEAAQARLSRNLMLNYLFSKRPDQALEHGQVALRLARQSGDRVQLAYVLNDLCRLHTCRGEFYRAHAVIQEARELWRSLENQVMLGDSFGSEAEAYLNAGEFDQSLQHSQQALQITEKIENLWGQSYDQMLMAFVHFERGELGRGIELAEPSIRLADRAGLIASGIGLRSELGWIYSYCGALNKGLEAIDRAFQVAETKQPAWKAFPQAAKIRAYLLQGQVRSAEQVSGGQLLEPISIPYARYTIFLSLANVELAFARGAHDLALALVEDLLNEVFPLTRVDIPEVLRWKGKALHGLGRLDESLQVLLQARALAQGSDCNLHLWPTLADLAEVHAQLGDPEAAQADRAEAKRIVEQIADSLREIGLRESFLSQPRVRELMSL